MWRSKGQKGNASHAESHAVDGQPQTISHLKIVEPLEVDMEVGFDTFNGPGQGHTSDQ